MAKFHPFGVGVRPGVGGATIIDFPDVRLAAETATAEAKPSDGEPSCRMNTKGSIVRVMFGPVDK